MELHQLTLVISFLFFFTRFTDNVGVAVSFLVVGLLYFFAMVMYRSNNDHLDNIDDDVYYDVETIAYFRVVLGRFTWVVSGSRNHY